MFMHNQCITTIDTLTRLHQNETGGNITAIQILKNTLVSAVLESFVQ